MLSPLFSALKKVFGPFVAASLALVASFTHVPEWGTVFVCCLRLLGCHVKFFQAELLTSSVWKIATIVRSFLEMI